MEVISGFISDRICSSLGFESRKKQVMENGISAIIQVLASALFIILLGGLFHVTAEALIIFITVNVIRKYTIGAQLGTPNKRLLAGSAGPVLAALLVKSFSYDFSLPAAAVLVYAFAYHRIFKYAPVEFKSDPLMYPGKRRRMKESAIKSLNISAGFTAINLMSYYVLKYSPCQVFSACIIFGAGWQTLMLTAPGKSFVDDVEWLMDSIVEKIRS